jgi:hypothetical protein
MRFSNFISFQVQIGALPLAFALVFLFVGATTKIYPQVSCGGEVIDNACLNHPSQTYECIDGDFNAPSLYGTKLLMPSQALNTPQYLLVKGRVTFTEDYTFAPGSDIVFLDGNSGFRVSADKKLTLLKSYLHGCARLWAGIEALTGGRISVDSCTFEDAKAAIILRNQSVIEATRNTFRKNVCGIFAASASSGVFSSIFLGSNEGISGNTFWGNDKLLEPAVPALIVPGIFFDAQTAPTDYPYTGIWIERVNSLTIGHLSTQAGALLNSFRDFGQNKEQGITTSGIRSILSNIAILNSTFDNFGLYDPFNTSNNIDSRGIYARNDAIVNMQTTVSGLNQSVPIPPNTFSNCFLDIYTVGTNLRVSDVVSYKAGISIWARMANSWQNPIICQIKNNKIDYFRGVGIDIDFFKPIAINIEDNQIFDNNELYDPAQRFGIRIRSLGLDPEINLSGSRIFNNKIISRSKLLGGAFFGIAILKTAYLTIEQNRIFEELAQSNLDAFYGIRVLQAPCNGSRILYNSVRGAGIDYVFAVGTYFHESLNCVFICNSTDNLNTGMAFFDNCDNADVSKNDFHFHERGLALGHPQVTSFLNVHRIGLQANKENRWYGTNSLVEAFALNQASALASIFEINSSNLNSIFWPSPRRIGTVDDNFVWFVPSATGPEANENEIACFISEPGPEGEYELADTDIKLLNSTYQPPLDYPALVWEAKWQFADRLNRNPALQNISNEAAQYYLNTFNDSYSSLNRVYQGYMNRWKPADPLTTIAENYASSLSDAITNRFALDAMLSVNPEENISLHYQMLEADSAIYAISVLLEQALENLKILIDQQVNALIADVDNVNCQEAYETDMKNVVKTLLLSHFTEGELTAEQAGQMAEIADKCRYSGGYAVLLARSLFEPKESYGQDSDCEAPQLMVNSAFEQSNPSVIRIFPNPTSESLTIQTNQAFERGKAHLFNAQGLLILDFDLFGQNTVFPVNTLKSGIYFLDVKLDGKPGMRMKFVVTR